MLIGIDTGGTFTDFVVFDGRGLRVHKVLSTPAAPDEAIVQGISELAIELDGLRVVHGSTVATNAVLEGKGARTVFITNHGFGDMLTLGRQARAELYNLLPPPVPPPVPPDLCLETGGRIGADGGVVEPLTERQLADLRAALERLRPGAVAVNLLFSFLDDRFEREIAAVVPDGISVSLSSQILPEYREYERGITTWLNAYVGPLVEGYLQRLQRRLAPARLAVMQSAGGTMSAEQAARHAVHMLLSGPAGGLVGARFAGRAAGLERLLTFDMGGTSTDVALLDGGIRMTTAGRIGPYPVGVPMVDMHTIGAGGGSVAGVDAGGALRVGPESAGASPGPVCYGQGGERPTVTDANVVLGRIPADAALGGNLRLDAVAARRSLETLADAAGLADAGVAAHGVIDVANEHMARALRVISVQRGIDPARFTLVSFGGAGGLHVCALATALGMRRAMVPVHAGVLSALGMLAAPPVRQLSRTVAALMASLQDADIEAVLEDLDAAGRAELAAEGAATEELRREPGLDLRYAGQSYTLYIAWRDRASACEAFHAAHMERYGHRLDAPVELVNIRLGLFGRPLPVELARRPGGEPAPPAGHAPVAGHGDRVPVYARESLVSGQALAGPTIVAEKVATTWLEPGWECSVDEYGNLLLSRGRPA